MASEPPTLILVNGLPGTGKTTLATRLAQDLSLPYMGKDMLKEFFYDALHTTDREQSRALGRAVTEMLYILIESCLSSGMPIVIESAFFVAYSRPKIQQILEKYPAHVIEVYCSTEKAIRRERYKARELSGNRHPGHIMAADWLGPDDPEPLDTYAPLEIGRLLKVDTTHFGTPEYDKLLTGIREELG